MPLNKATIKAAIIDVLNQPFDETTNGDSIKDQYADGLADVIIEAIQSADLEIPTGTIITAGSPSTQTQSVPGIVIGGLS